MNSEDMGKYLLEVQRLSRSDNQLDNVIAREMLAKIFLPISSDDI
jgi:hypothetical protein